ncbi:glycosyltransferase [Fictibacillus sp. NPDC058756]|uniref:glycosyltransferase n=1 Tax=Fictibacillus sp. NPDC058756 TaxID=3346625 RepID=UPI00368EE2E1
MFVSVVMAVYNGEKYLKEAIDSIIFQSYDQYELIIVNDASSDQTKAILDNIENKKIKIIHLNSNMGAAYALNLAIEHASGDWIAVHDADDVSFLNRIEEQVNFIKKHPEFVGVGSFIECISGPQNFKHPVNDFRKFENDRNLHLNCEQMRAALYFGCPLTHGTMMYSKKAFFNAGRYNTSLRIAYDYDLWTRLITVGPIVNVPKILYKYRRYYESLSNTNLNQTNSELFYSYLKFIRNTCFFEKSNNPSVVVFGKQEDFNHFDLAANALNVVNIFNKGDRNSINYTLSLFDNGKIDGVIILDNVRRKKKIVSRLQKNGLELNKHYFEFYLAN